MACSACHDISQARQEKIGPHLWEVIDRQIAAVEGFNYSDTLKSAQNRRWSIAELDAFITDPSAFGDGKTAMLFPGIENERQRLTLILYLASVANQQATIDELQARLSALQADAIPEQDFQGLPAGEGRELVFYSCNACHSLAIVKQQKLTSRAWEETLEWMVEEQGMDPLDAQDHDLVLAYLSNYFGQDKAD